jgi:hypothetical protein
MFNYTFSLEQVNTILRHLDMGAHRDVRQLVDTIIAETNRQQHEQQAANAPVADAPAPAAE